ncbi:ABC transporter ATP-binding protein [Altererythrobacter sp. KTW20L]|uniref:ABC transporter ATP-binding protein n=1 Tax=Altererythrobacter sp. KTW20L TaxID=2942210 RepID=UPI0020BD9D77|nr:ABC transporter ATP-binding protein [Altererythrobacter sp. KTW20L]MCL6251568.1 ABC transporter ATP-binding protein [Altererythrobacter sp. KTW20L]
MLSAHSITVRIGQCPIVDVVSLNVAPGEFVGLLGPNGAGKSTLIRALAGVAPHEGEVRLGDVPAAQMSPRERARLLSYLPQDRQIEWGISVREVVALGRHPFQRRFARLSGEDEAAIDLAMAETGIASIASRSAKVLSGGEKARVLLARALATGAPLLLADEPVAALDPFHQLAVMDILRRRAGTGTGVLAVLHELTLAARFLDRVIVMHRGGIFCEGPPEAVLVPEVLEQVYGVTPLTGQHNGERWLLPWKRL